MLCFLWSVKLDSYRFKVGTPHIPSQASIQKYLERSLRTKHLTNFGTNERLLTSRLQRYFQNEKILLVNNATNGLIISIQAAFSKKQSKIATTPYSFAATSNAIIYAGHVPVYMDINSNMEPEYLSTYEEEIDGFLGVNIYGIPSSLTSSRISLPVVIDNAHGFDVVHQGKNLANFGDISILSCHATKLFHTVEGGIIVINNLDVYEEIKDRSNFALQQVNVNSVGLNAKMSEFHAAMGLANFDELEDIISQRINMKNFWDDIFNENGSTKVKIIKTPSTSYYPLHFANKKYANTFVELMKKKSILCRLYFDRSLAKGYRSAELLAGTVVCIPVLSQYETSDLEYLKSSTISVLHELEGFD